MDGNHNRIATFQMAAPYNEKGVVVQW